MSLAYLLFCFIYGILCLNFATSAAYHTWNQTELLETTTQFPTYFVQMEKHLTAIPKGAANVQTINLGFNKITTLPPFAFSLNGFVELETIYMRQNQISTVSSRSFKALKQLRNIYLQGNNISSLEVNTFRTNFKLQKLDLSGNKLRFHNKPFLNSDSLETLILCQNKIDQIFKFTFSKLPNLKYLVINSNELFFIADYSFSHIKNLEYLSIVNTEVYNLSEEMFQNGSYPKIIDLTDTPLANTFNPPLTKVKNEGVVDLIRIDKYY